MNTNDRKTALFELHNSLDARMVSFAGYAMPVQFKDGIIAEHRHVREHAGLFDVSHMGQIRVSGNDAAFALERCMPVDIVGLGDGRQRYGFLTNDGGGIIDDLMVARNGDDFMIVANASRKDVDLNFLIERISDDVSIEAIDDRSLIAIQGPTAHQVVGKLNPQFDDLKFMDHREISLLGVHCYVSRSGYTGEDGYEISLPSDQCEAVVEALLNDPELKPIGLGARDTLRLEAGLCLYGQDIDTETSPIEAGLNWAIGKKRREAGERAGGFPGADVIYAQLNDAPERTRVGLKPTGRAPLRHGTELFDVKDVAVGTITSGGFGATVEGPVAMGYVAREFATTGVELYASVRGKKTPVSVCDLPFVSHRYKRG